MREISSDLDETCVSGGDEHMTLDDSDYTPGYPVDLRSDQTRTARARAPMDDFEAAAARVIARRLGVRVNLQDDGRGEPFPAYESSIQPASSGTARS